MGIFTSSPPALSFLYHPLFPQKKASPELSEETPVQRTTLASLSGPSLLKDTSEMLTP